MSEEEPLLGQKPQVSATRYYFPVAKETVLSSLFFLLYFAPQSTVVDIVMRVCMGVFSAAEITDIVLKIKDFYKLEKKSVGKTLEFASELVSCGLGAVGAGLVASGKAVVNTLVTAPNMFFSALSLGGIKESVKYYATGAKQHLSNAGSSFVKAGSVMGGLIYGKATCLFFGGGKALYDAYAKVAQRFRGEPEKSAELSSVQVQ